ncbi:hypothetical protein PanWU01x14_230590, partial [Parasponia andersonii]
PEIPKRAKALSTSTIVARDLIAADMPENSLRLSLMNVHRPLRHNDDSFSRECFLAKSVSPVIVSAHL